MESESLVDQIVRSLSFEVVAAPQNVLPLDSTSKSTPLNVKIKVRKKQGAGLRHGVISMPQVDTRTDSRKHEPHERIRLVSSDQTIMNFDVLMEAEFEKGAISNQKKPKLNLITPEDDKEFNSSPITKKNKDIFGKCKPGGCLDPPFGEDKYSYQPKEQNLLQPLKDNSTKLKSSSIFKNNIFKKRRKNSLEDGQLDQVDTGRKVETESFMDFHDTESLTRHSNPLITYPHSLDSNKNQKQDERKLSKEDDKANRVKHSSEDRSRTSSIDDGSYFVIPKKMKRLSNQSDLKEQPVSKQHGATITQLKSEFPNDNNVSEIKQTTQNYTFIPIPVVLPLNNTDNNVDAKSDINDFESNNAVSSDDNTKDNSNDCKNNTDNTENKETTFISIPIVLPLNELHNKDNYVDSESKYNNIDTKDNNDIFKDSNGDTKDIINNSEEYTKDKDAFAQNQTGSGLSIQLPSVNTFQTGNIFVNEFSDENSVNANHNISSDYDSEDITKPIPIETKSTFESTQNENKTVISNIDISATPADVEETSKEIYVAQTTELPANTSIVNIIEPDFNYDTGNQLDPKSHPLLVQAREKAILGLTDSYIKKTESSPTLYIPEHINAPNSSKNLKEIWENTQEPLKSTADVIFKDTIPVLDKSSTTSKSTNKSLNNEQMSDNLEQEDKNSPTNSDYSHQTELHTHNESDKMQSPPGNKEIAIKSPPNNDSFYSFSQQLNDNQGLSEDNSDQPNRQNKNESIILQRDTVGNANKISTTEPCETSNFDDDTVTIENMVNLKKVRSVSDLSLIGSLKEQDEEFVNLNFASEKTLQMTNQQTNLENASYLSFNLDQPPNTRYSMEFNTLNETIDKNIQPISILRKPFYKMDIALQSYIDENNERIIKSFDSKHTPQQRPNHSMFVTQCYLGSDLNEIKVPIDRDNDLNVKITPNQPVTFLRQDVVASPDDSTKKKNIKIDLPVSDIEDADKYSVNKSEANNNSNKLADEEIHNALNRIYDEELVPLQDIIKGLREEIDGLVCYQMKFNEMLSKGGTKRPKPIRQLQPNKRCTCIKKSYNRF